MPTESELVRSILQQPDADAPRLAYADWSAQQDGTGRKPRAEFIRLQLALAKLEPGSDKREEFTLFEDSRHLREENSRYWDGEVTALAKEPVYDRGFIELVTLEATEFLERGERLMSLAPVRHLNLTKVLPVAKRLFSSPLLRGIRSLELWSQGLGDTELAFLASSPFMAELRWLSLGRNRIGEEGAANLATSPYLRQLAYANFAGNRIEPNEDYSFDTGLVVDAGLPPAGLELERRFGHLPWLHHAATSLEDRVPDRFRIKPAPVGA